MTLGVEHEDGVVRDVLHERAVALLACPQGFFGAGAFLGLGMTRDYDSGGLRYHIGQCKIVRPGFTRRGEVLRKGTDPAITCLDGEKTSSRESRTPWLDGSKASTAALRKHPGQDRAASGGRQAAGERILPDNEPLHLLQVGFGHVSRASDGVQAGDVRVGYIESGPRLARRLLGDNASENGE